MRVRPGRVAPEPPHDLIARIYNRRRSFSRQQYVDGILNGQRAILAQAITLIESSRDSDRNLAEQILEECLSHSGNSIRLGITGVPGAGKSSLIEVLGISLIREHRQKVAVLAIDLADIPAAAFEEIEIHAQEHLGPILGFGAAGTGVNLDEAIQRVILTVEQRLEFDRLAAFLELGEFAVKEGVEVHGIK